MLMLLRFCSSDSLVIALLSNIGHVVSRSGEVKPYKSSCSYTVVPHHRESVNLASVL